MCGSSTAAAARDSRMNRCRNPWSMPRADARTFSATIRPSRSSRARNTSAMPPRPICPSRRYPAIREPTPTPVLKPATSPATSSSTRASTARVRLASPPPLTAADPRGQATTRKGCLPRGKPSIRIALSRRNPRRRLAEPLPVVRLVPVRPIRIDLYPPRRVVEETGRRTRSEPGERAEVRSPTERRQMVEVTGVAPQRGKVHQPPLADLPERVVPEIEPGQRGPQPHVGLGKPGPEQVPLPGQPLVERVQGAGQAVAELGVLRLGRGPGDPVGSVVHGLVHPLVQRVDVGAQGQRVQVERRVAPGAELGAQVDRDVREVVADQLPGLPVPEGGNRDVPVLA